MAKNKLVAPVLNTHAAIPTPNNIVIDKIDASVILLNNFIIKSPFFVCNIIILFLFFIYQT